MRWLCAGPHIGCLDDLEGISVVLGQRLVFRAATLNLKGARVSRINRRRGGALTETHQAPIRGKKIDLKTYELPRIWSIVSHSTQDRQIRLGLMGLLRRDYELGARPKVLEMDAGIARLSR